jgi:GntR family transcriptional regulator of arabinose operon
LGLKEVKRQKLVKGPVVLYEQMRLKILELIEERKLQPHDPVPSEGELADLFGVSRRTSKEALLALAKEGVVYRLPRRGTFLAQASGQYSAVINRSAGGTTKGFLAMVVPEIDDYVGRVLSAALQEAANKEWELLVRVSGGAMEKEEVILRELASDPRVRGIVLFPGGRKMCGDQVLRLHLEKYPIVILDRTFREINIPSAYHDHYQGAYELTEYLIRKGHRRIGFVSEEWFGVMSREERYHGFIQAHLDQKLAFNHDWIYAEAGDRNQEEAGRGTLQDTGRLAEFLQNNRSLTAIFCSNDYVALKVLNTALMIGIKVPDELSLAGFTDFTFSRLLSVPLTTVCKPPDTIGQAAIRLLCERIDHPDAEIPSIKLPTRLIERGSVLDRANDTNE